MIATILSLLAVVLAYLIGAIPFGLLIARAVSGIDIRTVGSGNIGATNVGRTLGLRWFAVVFVFDFAKGYLPTIFLPRLLNTVGYPGPPWLAVVIALAAIVGHNFPVYLGFKGGKGVATSLGSVFALEPIAGMAAVCGFVFFLLITKFVSMSSILAAIVFAFVYFKQYPTPWDSTHGPMSVATIALLVMMVVRHRANLARIAAGTENKVQFRRNRAPKGSVHIRLLLILTLLATVLFTTLWSMTRRAEVVVGSYRFHEVTRAATGHQRADRLAFAQHGKILAVNCPRYNRVVLYDVTKAGWLNKRHDLGLEGRPVALLATSEHLLVLQRPTLDHRHLGPGWFDTFDFDGNLARPRRYVGYDPDDFATLPGERRLVVLHSGKAEGESNRPSPDLTVLDLDTPSSIDECPRVVFDKPGDDPERIRLAADGRSAVVTFRYLNEVAKLDLSDLASPRTVERVPYNDLIPLAENPERETVALAPGIVLQTLPDGSALRVYGEADGVVPLFGPLKLSNVRPNGMAVSTERGLIAVASKAGSVHLIVAAPVEPAVAVVEGSSFK